MLNFNTNILFVNYDEYIKLNDYMNILCSSSGKISLSVSNMISNIPSNNIYKTNEYIRQILSEICPTKITDVMKLFFININDFEFYNYLDMIFKCSSCRVMSKAELLNISIYNFEKWFYSDSLFYTYFNSNKTNNNRVVYNSAKNIMTLKIQNEELYEDISAINILLKIKDDYILHIKAYVINDSYATIRNNTIFHKYFNNDVNYHLYNKLHLRDCCLYSFNGFEPFKYIEQVYNVIISCNSCCVGAQNIYNFIQFNHQINSVCCDTIHFIQKFARHCFHTKYLIIIYTLYFNINICVHLAIILLRCNNRMCKDFLDCLPHSYKSTMMIQSGFGSTEESKIDTVLTEKINLTQKINIWKQLFSGKYNMNVRRLIDRSNELIVEDIRENTDSNGEKEKIKKMISNFEKIGTRFYFLKIHSELIDVIDMAKNIFPNKSFFSINSVIEHMMISSNQSNFMNSSLGIAIQKYLYNFSIFEKKIRDQIMKLSEGQMAIKKAIWQYIISIVSTTNIFSTKKILCLIGPPGVGKTYIAIAIAKILFFEPDDNPSDDEVKSLVYILSIPGISSELRLLGSDSIYVGAGPGILVKELYFVEELCRKLIIFDEIDKDCKYIEQLLQILDYTQNSKITENYLGIEMDMKAGVLIATANDESKINPILCQRMDIIYLNGYSIYTKCKIVQNQLLKMLLKEKGFNENMLFINDDVLEDLIIKKTREAGVRKLKHLVMDIINIVSLAIVSVLTDNMNNIIDNITFSDIYTYYEYTIKELYELIGKRYINYLHEKTPIILTKNDLDIIFADKYIHSHDKVDNILNWRPGYIIGLYATSIGIGGILPIIIKFNKSLHKKGLIITTGAKDVMKDSANISTILTSDYIFTLSDEIFLNYFGITKEEFKSRNKEIANNAAIHIILDSSIQKDGPSAGGAFMIAHLSKIIGHTLSKNVGITGEISSNFIITEIAGLNMKINGAMLAGCRSVIVPYQNIDHIIKELVYDSSLDCKNELGKRIAFIYYSIKEKSYILLVRTKPYNDINQSLKSFDICIIESKIHYNDYSDDVPSLYKINLNININNLINNKDGLNIILFDNITLCQLMRTHFVILAMEQIPHIYYFMVMAKYVYETDENTIECYIDELNDINYDGNKIIEDKL